MDAQPSLHELVVTLRAPVVCLTGVDGQIRASGAQGLLAADVRVLSHAVVTVDGVESEPVAHGCDGASAAYAVGLVRDRGDAGPDPTVWLRRDREVLADGMRETLTLVNRSDDPLDATLDLELQADLLPIETIKAGRSSGAPVGPSGDGDAAVNWNARGVVVQVGASGASIVRGAAAATLSWRVGVDPRSSTTRRWSLTVHDPAAVATSAPRGLDRTLTVTADDPRLPRLLHRALDDLDALLLTDPGRPDLFAAAGAPWYVTLFGRDSLWTATMLLPVDVALAGGTLRTLARVQGTRLDPLAGEEPGKIPHERRRGPTKHEQVGAGMTLPPLYYGTIDATPLWICLLRDAWRWGLPSAEIEALLPNLDAALGWIREHADRDGDGFAEYLDDSGAGLANQGWKDSVDAIRFADGRLAAGSVALAEVQGYLHEAALAGAELLDAFGRAGAQGWRTWAAALATRFRERFWVPAGHPALALDGDKTPVDALTSNIGHLLGTGLLDAAESERVGARLLEPDMASGYGLRTMATSTGGYSPFSYHCGSVWPHDTAVVMRGLARAGQAGRAAALAYALVTASDGFDARLPELFAGFGADEVAAPVPYPASCRPQAWAAAAAVAILQTALGLAVDVPAGTGVLRPPAPGPFGALSVRGLGVGGGRLDVDVDRGGRVTHVVAPPGVRVVVG